MLMFQEDTTTTATTKKPVLMSERGTHGRFEKTYSPIFGRWQSFSSSSSSSFSLGSNPNRYIHSRYVQTSTNHISAAAAASTTATNDIHSIRSQGTNSYSSHRSVSGSSSSSHGMSTNTNHHHHHHHHHPNNEDALNFTNATIQRLLQEELYSMENNNNHNNDHNHHPQQQDQKMSDIKQVLKEKQKQLPKNRHMTQQDHNHHNNHHKPTMMAQLLENFNPQSPPTGEHVTLEDIQQWLECSAQQESVEKYESMIENTRHREDYTSLSIVQKHILEWYHPLRQRIVQEQEYYFSKKNKDSSGKSRRKTSNNKYGPYVCTLQAEKLALLTIHEATMFALKKGGQKTSTVVTMAFNIGDAVEAEVNVQRLLKQRMEDQRRVSMKEQRRKIMQEDGLNADGSRNMENSMSTLSVLDDNDDDDNDTEDVNVDDNHPQIDNDQKSKLRKEMKNSWMYGPSHLQRFTDELNRSDPSRKGKIRIQRANRRAMQLLENSEPWPRADKVLVGVVLLQMLIETAKIKVGGSDDGDDGVPAFQHERRWLSDTQTVGCITMNEDFYKMVVEDKFTSMDAYTTRHKPMVVPPMDWVSWNDGGYKVLNCEFMRTKGCQIQKVREEKDV